MNSIITDLIFLYLQISPGYRKQAAQLAITCSDLTIEILGQGVKFVHLKKSRLDKIHCLKLPEYELLSGSSFDF